MARRKKAGQNHKKRQKRIKRSFKRLGYGWALRQKRKHSNRGRSRSTR